MPAETAVGVDLGNVRLHTDGAADRISRQLNATAFTVGDDVFMSKAAGDPVGAGRDVLAHELGHVVDGGSDRVHRLWGWGNTGRTREEEDEIAAADTSIDSVVTELTSLLTGRKKSNYAGFNRAMGILLRPDISAVQSAYDGRRKRNLVNDITAKFKGLRSDYLVDVATSQAGTPSAVSRVRLALGSGSYGVAAVTSDQKEVLRLANKMSGSELNELWEGHYHELWKGLSPRALRQIGARRQALSAIPEAQDQADGRTPAALPLDVARKKWMLDKLDRELGKMLSGAMKGESTFLDELAVKVQFNLSQFAGELDGWLDRAKQLEKEHFGGEPTIRHYVLGIDVDLNAKGVSETVTGGHFLKKMLKRQVLVGWNDGDRMMIRMMISAGTSAVVQQQVGVKQPKSVMTYDAVDAVNEGRSGSVAKDDGLLNTLQAAVARCDDTTVSKALAGVAAEMVIQKKRGAKSRVDRTVLLLNQLTAEHTDTLYSVLDGPRIAGAAPLSKSQRSASRRILYEAMSAAKLDPKEIARVAARLSTEHSSDAYVAMRRYASKVSFKPKKFDQLVANLSPEQLSTARADKLLCRILTRVQIQNGFKPDSHPITSRHKLPTPASLADADGFNAKAWANRWSLFINGVKDRSRTASKKSEKKIYSFALDIYDEGGSSGLHDTFDLLDGKAQKRLMKFGLGKALAKKTEIGGSGYDLVGKIISKSMTARPNGKADVEAITGTFESLSADNLLDEWTNVHEFEPLLQRRVSSIEVLYQLADLYHKTEEGSDKRGRILKGIELHRDRITEINTKLRSTFRLRIRDDRRATFNTGVKQVTTGEYFAVTSAFADHISSQLGTPGMKEALVRRGLMPTEFTIASEELLFVADRAKESNVATWHQWALFTSRGQLREESVGLLNRGWQDLSTKVGVGAPAKDIASSRKNFAGARKELAARTKTFKDTAKKYTERLKKIIGLLLTIAIAAGTLGAGAIPSLAQAIISAATNFAKDMILAVVDKVMMPSESNLLSEAGISLAKNTIKGAAQFGLDQVTYLLDVQLGLVDPNASGLTGGTYWDPTAAGGAGGLMTSAALKWGSAEEWGATILSGVVDASLSKVSNKLIDTSIKAATSDGEAAWKAMFTDLGLNDLIDVTIAPVFDRIITQMKVEMNGQFLGKQTHTHEGKDYVVVTDLGKKWSGGKWDWATSSADDSYTKNSALSLGGKIGAMLAGKAEDQTVFAFIDTVASIPVDVLEKKIDMARQRDDTSKHESLDPGASDAEPEHGAEGERTIKDLDTWDEFVMLTVKLMGDHELTKREAHLLALAVPAVGPIAENRAKADGAAEGDVRARSASASPRVAEHV